MFSVRLNQAKYLLETEVIPISTFAKFLTSKLSLSFSEKN